MLYRFSGSLYANLLQMPFCILMDGLVKAGQIPEAKLIFDEMKRKEVKNGIPHLIYLLLGYFSLTSFRCL